MQKPLLILLIISLLLTVANTAVLAAEPTVIILAAAADDAYEYQASGFVSWLDDQIQVDGGTFAGMRFAVPADLAASSATLTLTADTSTLACSHMPIRLETADDAADYATGQTIWQRTYTSQAITATVPPLAAAGETWTSPNLASLVNEIISRPGWRSGNHIAIVIGPCARDTDITELYSYDMNPTLAPRLDITWAEPSGIYIIPLPSGGQATLSMDMSAGQALVAIALAAIVTLLLYRQLRGLSHIST